MTIAGIFIQTLFTDPHYFFLMTFIVVFSICLHEYSHAQVALWMGDSTAADRGHLTLNPLKQMGWFSILIFLVLGFAWGAVPVNRANMKGKYGAVLTSFAGPGINLILFAISWCLFGAVCHMETDFYIRQFFALFGLMNFVLFFINMLPIPGLDGWNIYVQFFPRLAIPNSEFVKGAMVIFIFAAFLFVDKLFELGWTIMKLAAP
ncbi:MAG: site-2 protease family protein [Lentisphaeria bacterium]|nr:site-2 protease family protein [Lentisphaeria bacterium]